jgi:NitT/TauT family transport system substrate-binding protein
MAKFMAKFRVIGMVLLSVAVLAACSSSKSSSASSASSANTSGAPATVTNIKVGTSPALSNISLYYAASPGGIFSKHNLNMTPQVVQSGAQAIPLLLNGQLQFTAADPLSTMVAIQKHVPLVIVASGNTAGINAAHDNTGLIVKPSITSVADLAGKTIAVNGLNGLAEVSTKAAIDAKGGDSSKVNFVELPIPQMQSAVQAGTVAGAVTTEPFLTAATRAGLTDLLPVLSISTPGVPQIVYIASKSYVASNPDVVKAFTDSITEANMAVTNNPSLIKTVAAKSTTIPLATLNKVILPVFDPPTVKIAILSKLQNLAVKYGGLSATFNVTPYVYTG